MDELQTEVTYTCTSPVVDMQACFLRFRAEDGIAATYIGHHRMRAAANVADGDTVLFAGAAAVFIACAGREETAEDAVLSVEDREVLPCDRFDPISADFPGEGSDLIGIQIERGRDTLQPQIQERAGAS
jgi:hypothetical protein